MSGNKNPSRTHAPGSPYKNPGEDAGRYNIQDVHAFVVIVFIAVFILGLMIKITFF